jgi:hypothetical protein
MAALISASVHAPIPFSGWDVMLRATDMISNDLVFAIQDDFNAAGGHV